MTKKWVYAYPCVWCILIYMCIKKSSDVNKIFYNYLRFSILKQHLLAHKVIRRLSKYIYWKTINFKPLEKIFKNEFRMKREIIFFVFIVYNKVFIGVNYLCEKRNKLRSKPNLWKALLMDSVYLSPRFS